MHLELKLHRLDLRRKYHLDTLVFKCLNGLSPQYLSSLLISLDQARTVATRAADVGNLHIPYTRTKTGEKAFSVMAPGSWNMLPMEMKEEQTLKNFKTTYINIVSESYF